MTEDIVPDLYELAFMPGCFKCPKCGFVLSKATIDVAAGRVGTTEQNRQSEPCPNDGTFMVHVTWKEQVEVYAERLKETFNERDALRAELDAAKEVIRRCHHGMSGYNGLTVTDGQPPSDDYTVDLSLELAACDAVVPPPYGGASKWTLVLRSKILANQAALIQALRSLRNEARGFIAMADESTHGCTNIQCLQNRIDDASRALDTLPE
jgi:hypothetical protein